MRPLKTCLIWIGGLIFLSMTILFTFAAGPYLYCLYREPWNLQSLTKAEVEKQLPLSITEDITDSYSDPKTGSWASGYILPPGGKVIRYFIWFTQPLDVAYDQHGLVLEYFTSYE